MNCPVCGYGGLTEPPSDFTICPTEFGYDDATRSHEELREEWVRNGSRWAAENVMGQQRNERAAKERAEYEPDPYDACDMCFGPR